MANRRMLQKSYSNNEPLNDCNDFEKVVYLMAIPHLDDFGRINGSARVFKSMVLPMDSRTVEEFESAILDLEESQLILRYESQGEKVILYPKFEEEQTGLKKRTKSKYPDPPQEIKEKFPDISVKDDLTEPNLTEENLTQSNQTENRLVSYKSVEEDNHPSQSHVDTMADDIQLSDRSYLYKLATEGEMDIIVKAYKEYKVSAARGEIKSPEHYFKSIVLRLKNAKYDNR